MESNVLTITEYAAAHRLHPNTVHKMIRDGRLPGARQEGYGWRIPIDAIPLRKDGTEAAEPMVIEQNPSETDKGDVNELEQAERSARIEKALLASAKAKEERMGIERIINPDIIKNEWEALEKQKASVADKLAAYQKQLGTMGGLETKLNARTRAVEQSEKELEQSRKEWDDVVKLIQHDLEVLRTFFDSIVATTSAAKDILIPKLELSEDFYLGGLKKKEQPKAEQKRKPKKEESEEEVEVKEEGFFEED